MPPQVIILIIPFFIGFIWWKQSLPFFLYWTLIEGAFRKWILPSTQAVFLFVGPILIIGAFTRYFINKMIGKAKYPTDIKIGGLLGFLLVAYFIFAVAQSFNPDLPSPVMGFIALFVHFMFVPMLYLVPVTFESIDGVVGFIKPYVFWAILLSILASIQLLSPRSSFINIMVSKDYED